MAILSLIGFFVHATVVYLKYKVMVWLAYRLLSGLCHGKAKIFADVAMRGAIYLGILFPLSWFTFWMANTLDTADGVIVYLPLIFFSAVAWKIIKRECCTFAGLWEKDWNWNNPTLRLFHISPCNMPDTDSRSKRFNYKNDDNDSGKGWFEFFTDINTTGDAANDAYYDNKDW